MDESLVRSSEVPPKTCHGWRSVRDVDLYFREMFLVALPFPQDAPYPRRDRPPPTSLVSSLIIMTDTIRWNHPKPKLSNDCPCAHPVVVLTPLALLLSCLQPQKTGGRRPASPCRDSRRPPLSITKISTSSHDSLPWSLRRTAMPCGLGKRTGMGVVLGVVEEGKRSGVSLSCNR